MSTINNDKIETINLYTNKIKTNKLGNICLENSATMTIKADECDIDNPSKWKLKIDETNFQTFQITLSPTSMPTLAVPQNWTLKADWLRSATIHENTGSIQSTGAWSTVSIYGIEKATLDTVDRIVLRNTSHVKFIFPDDDDAWEDITYRDPSNGMVRYSVGSKYYEHMRWDNVYSLIDGDWYDIIYNGGSAIGGTTTGIWYHAGNSISVIQGYLTASCAHTAKITGWYDTTFEATIEK